MNVLKIKADVNQLKWLKTNHSKRNFLDYDSWYTIFYTSTTLIIDNKDIRKTICPWTLSECLPDGESVTELNNMEICTCTCGISGCAGIFDGTNILLDKYNSRIIWEDLDCGFPQNKYIFELSDYSTKITNYKKIMSWVIGENNIPDEDIEKLIRAIC